MRAKRKGKFDGKACRIAQEPETLLSVNAARLNSSATGQDGGVMEHARPLPPELVTRYRAWQERRTPEGVARHAETAARGQIRRR